jgi:hypothetical protein
MSAATTEREHRFDVYNRAWNGINAAVNALEEGHFPEMRKKLLLFKQELDDAIDAETAIYREAER